MSSSTPVTVSAAEFEGWRLPRDLHFQRHIASGAYGDVVEVYRASDSRRFAVKRIRDVFGGDPRRFASALREITILRQLDCSCVPKLYQVFIVPPFPAASSSDGAPPTTESSSLGKSLEEPSSIVGTIEKPLGPGNPAAVPRAKEQLTPASAAVSPRSDSTDADSPESAAFASSLARADAKGVREHLKEEGKEKEDEKERDDQGGNARLPRSTDVFLLLGYSPADLSRLCRTPKQLSFQQVRLLFTQLLLALLALQRRGVIHRDLKPSNILVHADCTVKVTDFGQATIRSSNLRELPQYSITTRWYRAPEAIAGLPMTAAVDMWAAGCVLAELLEAALYPLYSREPLFPGTSCVPWSPEPNSAASDSGFEDDEDEDEDKENSGLAAASRANRANRCHVDQRDIISRRIGVKPLRMSALAALDAADYERLQRIAAVFRPSGHTTDWLEKRYAGAPPAARQLLSGLLTLGAEERLSVEQALCHPWIYDGAARKEIDAALAAEHAAPRVSLDLANILSIEGQTARFDASHEPKYYRLILDQVERLAAAATAAAAAS